MHVEEFRKELMDALNHPEQWATNMDSLTHVKTRIFIPRSHLQGNEGDIIVYSRCGSPLIVISEVRDRELVVNLVKAAQKLQRKLSEGLEEKARLKFLSSFKGFE